MNTKVFTLNTDEIDSVSKSENKAYSNEAISYSAEIIKNGGTVAFPTETVYGLGADAFNEEAVAKIFKAKGRPSDNPLIVHVDSIAMTRRVVADIPEIALLLIEAFWPGPLTLVLSKAPQIPKLVTAGLETVAVRMPAHPVALALIREASCPIAAPSANISGKPSSTDGRHVITDLLGKIDVILDAGPVDIGLESTVLDLTACPRILRPGGITPEELSSIIGPVQVPETCTIEDHKPLSPGMKYTHYAPEALLYVVEGGTPEEVALHIRSLAMSLTITGKKVGILATDQTVHFYENLPYVISAGNRNKPLSIASRLFSCLREFDDFKVEIVYTEGIPATGHGLAIMNRLYKAAGMKIINVSL
ncbi:MAG: L-threonylcarbamoyladenylate synthase [Clostridiales bacterium]|nr:L-threonylcarbamoyladenylate synthase [Clostridiales bacterium]